jgi:hypothetical protein
MRNLPGCSLAERMHFAWMGSNGVAAWSAMIAEAKAAASMNRLRFIIEIS